MHDLNHNNNNNINTFAEDFSSLAAAIYVLLKFLGVWESNQLMMIYWVFTDPDYISEILG